MGSGFSKNQTKEVSDAKRTARAQAIVSATAFDEAQFGEYTKATATEIVARIESGEWTASKVLEAYIARSSFAQNKTNCLTEVMYQQARKRARALDDEFATTKQLKGPLHGVPMSFKDQFSFVGVDSTLGFSNWANKPCYQDADVVTQLVAAGAVPFTKTNVPQTLFAFECNNPVWGRSLNPYNDAYTPGGSSGGEAALLAMDGSALGVGTDIGGSLRIPALYSGIYSLKPGSGRVSMKGCIGATPGFEGITAVAGPMSRSVVDLELACKVFFGGHSEDPRVAPVPFRQVDIPKKIRYGYYLSDGYVKSSPACQRAVLETVEALQKQGHECIEIALPPGAAVHAFNIFIGLTSADGYKTMTSHIKPDPKDSSILLPTLAPKLHWVIRSLAAWIAEKIVGDSFFASSIRSACIKPMYSYMQYIVQRNDFRDYFNKEVWARYELDGIIAPVQAIPQLAHGGCTRLSALASATILYNTLDIPAGVIPVTRVNPTLDKITDEWAAKTESGSPLMEKTVYSGKQPYYNPAKMAGMPVGVHIVGRRWEEEKVLGMMRVADDALGERGFGPGAWDLHQLS